MLKKSYNEMLRRCEWLPVALLLILGFALRLYAIGSVPFGLNQDEASAGYEAWALLTSGIDRNGYSAPALFVSWGSGQNVLMSYMAMPFIALFGLTELSVRVPNAVCGCLSLVVFWLFARRCRGRSFALCALFVLVINPWHIQMSRWALESNLLPFFLLLGVYFTSLAKDRRRALIPAAVSFGLALYAYGTAFFFLPLFLVAAVIWLGRRLEFRSFAAAFLLFLLIALPIGLTQLINMLPESGELSLFGMSLPLLTENRQAATSVFGGGLKAVGDNLKSLISIITKQSDGLVFNAVELKKGGMFYFYGIPFAAVGLLASLGRRKQHSEEMPMLLWLMCALVSGLFINGNINRLNMLWLPMVYFTSVGIYVALCKLGDWAALPVAGMFACLCIFCANYKETFAGEGNSNYFPGLGEAIEYCESMDAESIHITNYVNQPYIFALFYSQTPPEEFIQSVNYVNLDAAFRQVSSFGKYSFGEPSAADAELLIVHRGQARGYKVLCEFGSYAVCEGK